MPHTCDTTFDANVAPWRLVPRPGARRPQVFFVEPLRRPDLKDGLADYSRSESTHARGTQLSRAAAGVSALIYGSIETIGEWCV